MRLMGFFSRSIFDSSASFELELRLFGVSGSSSQTCILV
jgi:hypothetical protein